MQIKVINKSIVINDVPLEKIIVEHNVITVDFDDVNETRYRLYFKPCQAFKITTADCADISELLINENLQSGRYQRHILEVENSEWIKQLKKVLEEKDENAKFMDKARHFILDLRDNIIEIVALNYELVQVQN